MSVYIDKVIIDSVAAVTGVTLDMMRSRVRVRKFVYARIVLSVMLMNAGLVQREIADILNRNKACIYYYRQQFDGLVMFDRPFADLYRRCREAVDKALEGEQ